MPETILRFSPADVLRLSFECGGCGSVIALTSKQWKTLRSIVREGTDCPAGCGHTWLGQWLGNDANETERAVDRAFDSLKYLAERESQQRFVVRLELLAPSAK